MTVSWLRKQQIIPRALLSRLSPPALPGLLAPGWAFPMVPRELEGLYSCTSCPSVYAVSKAWPGAAVLLKEILCASLTTSLYSELLLVPSSASKSP